MTTESGFAKDIGENTSCFAYTSYSESEITETLFSCLLQVFPLDAVFFLSSLEVFHCTAVEARRKASSDTYAHVNGPYVPFEHISTLDSSSGVFKSKPYPCTLDPVNLTTALLPAHSVAHTLTIKSLVCFLIQLLHWSLEVYQSIA